MHRKSSRRTLVLAACACALSLGLVAARLLAGPFKGDRAKSTPRPAVAAPGVPSTSASSPAPTLSLRSARPRTAPKPNRRAGQRLLTMVNCSGLCDYRITFGRSP